MMHKLDIFQRYLCTLNHLRWGLCNRSVRVLLRTLEADAASIKHNENTIYITTTKNGMKKYEAVSTQCTETCSRQRFFVPISTKRMW